MAVDRQQQGYTGGVGSLSLSNPRWQFQRRIRSKLEMLQNLPMRICANDSNEFIELISAVTGSKS